MVKGVIFDVDGTLVNSVDLHAQAWTEALQHFGYDVAFEAVRAQIGKGGDQLIPVFVPPEDLERRQEEIDSFRSDLFKREYLERVTGFPGVRPLFERLRADGRRIVLASSAKGDELSHYKRVVGITDLVDAETSSDDADRSKPYPDIFQAALDRSGLRAEEAVVVGDSPWDAEAAGRAGLAIIGVLCGGFEAADLRQAGCVELYRDPEDLLGQYGRCLLAKP